MWQREPYNGEAAIADGLAALDALRTRPAVRVEAVLIERPLDAAVALRTERGNELDGLLRRRAEDAARVVRSLRRIDGACTGSSARRSRSSLRSSAWVMPSGRTLPLLADNGVTVAFGA